MNRLFVILLLLCAWVNYPMLHAQIYTTSSASYRSYSTSGLATQPTTSAFRSTSAFKRSGASASVAPSISYSTAPMRVANGTITTAASKLQGGVLTEQSMPVAKMKGRQNTMAPPDSTEEFVPLGDGWDVALLLAILCMGYALYLRHQKRKAIAKQ